MSLNVSNVRRLVLAARSVELFNQTRENVKPETQTNQENQAQQVTMIQPEDKVWQLLEANMNKVKFNFS